MLPKSEDLWCTPELLLSHASLFTTRNTFPRAKQHSHLFSPLFWAHTNFTSDDIVVESTWTFVWFQAVTVLTSTRGRLCGAALLEICRCARCTSTQGYNDDAIAHFCMPGETIQDNTEASGQELTQVAVELLTNRASKQQHMRKAASFPTETTRAHATLWCHPQSRTTLEKDVSARGSEK